MRWSSTGVLPKLWGTHAPGSPGTASAELWKKEAPPQRETQLWPPPVVLTAVPQGCPCHSLGGCSPLGCMYIPLSSTQPCFLNTSAETPHGLFQLPGVLVHTAGLMLVPELLGTSCGQHRAIRGLLPLLSPLVLHRICRLWPAQPLSNSQIQEQKKNHTFPSGGIKQRVMTSGRLGSQCCQFSHSRSAPALFWGALFPALAPSPRAAQAYSVVPADAQLTSCGLRRGCYVELLMFFDNLETK